MTEIILITIALLRVIDNEWKVKGMIDIALIVMAVLYILTSIVRDYAIKHTLHQMSIENTEQHDVPFDVHEIYDLA